MRSRVLHAASFGLVVGLSGCSLFTDTAGLSDGAPAAEAGPTDASVLDAPRDAAGLGSEAGDAGGPAVLVESSFESALDCDGWNAEGNVAPRAPGATGARSCSLCSAGAFTAVSRSIVPARAGSYAFEFKVRAESGTVSTFAGIDDRDKKRFWEGRVIANGEWQPHRGSFSLAAERDGGLGFFVLLEEDGCVLLDDMRILYQPP